MNEFIDWIVGIMTKSVIIAPSCDQQPAASPEGHGEPISQPDVTASQMAELIKYQERAYPTHAEQRDAWVRRNGPDESESDD